MTKKRKPRGSSLVALKAEFDAYKKIGDKEGLATLHNKLKVTVTEMGNNPAQVLAAADFRALKVDVKRENLRLNPEYKSNRDVGAQLVY